MSTNRKTLPCERCGRHVLVGAEAEAVRCWACTGFQGDPPPTLDAARAGTARSLETPHLAEVKECCNCSTGACILRGPGRCIVLEGGRCGWYERAVRPAGRLSGRICAGCGAEVGSRRRLCDSCRRAASRNAKREWKRRKESLVDSFAPQTVNTPANSQTYGGVSCGNDPR